MNEKAAVWKGPLAGVRVLDFTRVLAGPFATQILSDLGADIIKLEPPGSGDDTRGFPPHKGGESHYFVAINRGKRSMVVDLRREEGKEIVRKLVADVDVVVENYRPGVMDKLGIGYDVLSAINPQLIYCAISGFGLTGPLRDKPSFDIVTQALSGAMSVNGEAGRLPVKMGLPMGDLCGGIFGAIGVLSAIIERQATGKGRLIDVSLQDGLLGLLGYLPQLAFFIGEDPVPVGSSHPYIVPYNSYAAMDGAVLIACLTPGFFGKLCEALDIADWGGRADLQTMEGRRDAREEIDAKISNVVARHTVNEMVALLERFDVPHAPILSISQALHHPHSLERGMIETVNHPAIGELQLVGRPIKFVGSTPPPLERPPLLGEHGREILFEAGFDAEQIDKLETLGVLRAACGKSAPP
jgi:crotonobetainyl-CoA:carnitine CoA-transferase CaiB-like acyl-CoA transferase